MKLILKILKVSMVTPQITQKYWNMYFQKKQIQNHSAMRKYNINRLENPDTSLNKGRNFSKKEKSAMLKKKKVNKQKKEKFIVSEKLLRQMLSYNPQNKFICTVLPWISASLAAQLVNNLSTMQETLV